MRIAALVLASALATPAHAAEPAIAPTYAAIAQAIRAHEAAHPGETLTVAQLLARLPQDFRAGFTLMHTSESIQDADAQAPRAILFGDDARTVLTFNGRPDQAGYARLEIATANAATGALEFRAIELPEGDTGQGQAVFSDPNPPRCMGCHGPTPHYIWGQYAQWPGAYGSRDDALELAGSEKADLLAFRATAAQNARYASLVFGAEAQAPYRALRAGQPGTDRGDYRIAIEARPNFRLGALLMRHQARARAAELIAAPDFSRKKHALGFFLAGCPERFDAPAAAVAQKAGFDDYLKGAAALGSVPLRGWHLTRGAEADQYADYYAGLNTFRSALIAHLFPRAFAGDAEILGHVVPLAVGDYVRSHDTYGFKDGDRGQQLWEAIDGAGLIPTTLAGAFEADFYVEQAGMPRLTKENGRKLCAALSRRALAQ